MPDNEVKTIQDLIFFQYAKIIAKSIFGKDAKQKNYGFIKKKFRELKSGEISWSGILREDKQLLQTEKKCIYCGSETDLSWDHIIPKTINLNSKCKNCDRIHGIHNFIWACKSCNSKKHTKGLYLFYKEEHLADKKYYDSIPAILEKKYLKTIYHCHECNSSLDNEIAENGSVLDIDLT